MASFSLYCYFSNYNALLRLRRGSSMMTVKGSYSSADASRLSKQRSQSNPGSFCTWKELLTPTTCPSWVIYRNWNLASSFQWFWKWKQNVKAKHKNKQSDREVIREQDSPFQRSKKDVEKGNLELFFIQTRLGKLAAIESCGFLSKGNLKKTLQ